MLRILEHRAWRHDAEAGHSNLTIDVGATATRLRVSARWIAPGPRPIAGAYRDAGSEADAEALHFLPVLEGSLARLKVAKGGGELRLQSDRPPDRLEFHQFADDGFSTAVRVLPAMGQPPSTTPPGVPDDIGFAAAVKARLVEDGLAAALKLFTYARCGIPDGDLLAGAREILSHLSRYPLDRDPLLGAFLASLSSDAGR